MKCHNEMQRKVNKLYERVVESEARDGEQEREVKSSLERVMHAMQTEIKSLKLSQEDLIQKLRDDITSILPEPLREKLMSVDLISEGNTGIPVVRESKEIQKLFKDKTLVDDSIEVEERSRSCEDSFRTEDSEYYTEE